jgi:hypothetical protein
MPHDWTEDQVTRRLNFSRDHPEVSSMFRRETGQWEATFPAGENGARTIYGLELRHALDKLEERFG